MNQARLTTPLFSIRPYVGVSVNKYFQEMKPLMLLLWASGCLPYFFNKEGFAPFKLLSFSVFYTVVFFTIQSAWTIHTLSYIANEKIFRALSYDEALFWVSFSFILILNLTIPIAKWLDSRKVVKFVSNWQHFQVNHMSSELETSLSLPIKIFAVLIVPIILVYVYIQTCVLTHLPYIMTVPFITAVGATSVSFVHWCATFYELRVAARVLLRKVTMNGCRQTSTYRLAWLELSNLVSEMGESYAFTGITLTIIFFTFEVLTTYALLTTFFISPVINNNLWALFASAIACFIITFILYDAAHRTTQEVGHGFSSKILALDLLHLSDSEINKVSLFLQTMSEHPPVVAFLGLLTVDRNLFVSNVSNAVTYLVVLVQFKGTTT